MKLKWHNFQPSEVTPRSVSYRVLKLKRSNRLILIRELNTREMTLLFHEMKVSRLKITGMKDCLLEAYI